MNSRMTEFIASVVGPYLLLTGTGFYLSQDFYRKMLLGQTTADPILVNLSGASHFIVGGIGLACHFEWTTLEETVVSLVALAAVIKGAALIVFPGQTTSAPKLNNGALHFTAVIFLITGAYLTCVGHMAYLQLNGLSVQKVK